MRVMHKVFGCLSNRGLVQGGQINAQRCISFLTQTKSFIPDEFRDKIGNRVYGCDSCQTACPVNKGKNFHFHEELEANSEIAKPLLKPILKLSNREFKAKFGHVAGSWRGKKPIQRNAIIALAHFKDETAIPELVDVLENEEAQYQEERLHGPLEKLAVKQLLLP